MPRRRASSAKQKKARLQLKRAVKRGEVSPLPAVHRRARFDVKEKQVNPNLSGRSVAATESSRRLQSFFVKLPKAFLDETRRLAAVLPLSRPIASDVAIWKDVVPPLQDAAGGAGAPQISQLTCPKRPKWRYDMSKAEVENNEEAHFKKWLEQTDAAIGGWNDIETLEPEGQSERMPSAPTSFERNLEVWRELWRVTEISQIILILLDSRCPLLHYPPSLAAYLSSPQFLKKRIILVLTKVDIAGPSRTEAWMQYFKTKYPGTPVVAVESYIEKSAGEGTGQRKFHQPFIPSAFRQKLVEALREAHASLLDPPEQIKDVPDKLQTWKPPVKREINWDLVMTTHGGQTGSVVPEPALPPEQASEESQQEQHEPDLDFLTIGLIGQPNVGKSSLLNALFGTSKVRTSKTPGKTRHPQTLFWTPEVRFVDCPGLVMPNFVPMEMQVLAGILPISRVSAVPLCTYHASRLLPLETMYGLQHPSEASASAPEEDKRTWRVPRTGQPPKAKELQWTAMDILIAYALKKGYFTAMAGRPDISRAGNAILRSLAEGRILWAFWPPDTPPATLDANSEQGIGIWIPHTIVEHQDLDDVEHQDFDDDSDEDTGSEDTEEDLSDDGSAETVSGDSELEEAVEEAAGSRFIALSIDEEDEPEESED